MGVCVCGLCEAGTLKHTPAECGGAFHNVLACSLVGVRPVYWDCEVQFRPYQLFQ